MTPEQKAEALYNKFFRIVDKSNSLEDMDKTTRQLCNLFVTETLTSFVINLSDYQKDFWIEVQKEIEKNMKTPLQELMHYMEQNQYFVGNDLLAKYNELLEKEKQVYIKLAEKYYYNLNGKNI